MVDFVKEFKKAYNGDAWHGNNISKVISSVKATQAFQHPIPNAHSIAELVIHLTGWTEEVVSRFKGKLPSDPVRGDWPLPSGFSTENWDTIVNEFNLANEAVLEVTGAIDTANWDVLLPGKESSLKQSNHFELLNGLIQHHAYHAGQIALLTKF